jgi:hypothetical protein
MKSTMLAMATWAFVLSCSAQVLVDSIPYPGISQGFWGIDVRPDTVFLGADFSGDVYFSDHAGVILGQQATGFNFNHGLVRRAASYLIAQDFTTNGAHLYEVAMDGSLLNTWTFPDVIGGHSSGIGDICADGAAVWYTMYYPDFDAYPFAYAYKWVPGDAAPSDTVPLHGEQPYGIALKGDTLLYVTDNLNGDAERIYAYSLTSRQDLGFVDLPDPDGDQSPRGMCYYGQYLYLVANRMGGSANAYQTVYIYAFDGTTGLMSVTAPPNARCYPSPADDQACVILPSTAGRGRWKVEVLDAAGRIIHTSTAAGERVDLRTGAWPAGAYAVRAMDGSGILVSGRLVVAH